MDRREKISESLKKAYSGGEHRRISPFYRTWFPFSTSLFIRRYLESIHPDDDYVWAIWKEGEEAFVSWWKEEKVKRGIPIPEESVLTAKWGSYQNFCNYFYWLRRLELIEETRMEPAREVSGKAREGGWKKRHYYKISDLGLETPSEDVKWRNPRRALYPKSWEEHH